MRIDFKQCKRLQSYVLTLALIDGTAAFSLTGICGLLVDGNCCLLYCASVISGFLRVRTLTDSRFLAANPLIHSALLICDSPPQGNRFYVNV